MRSRTREPRAAGRPVWRRAGWAVGWSCSAEAGAARRGAEAGLAHLLRHLVLGQVVEPEVVVDEALRLELLEADDADPLAGHALGLAGGEGRRHGGQLVGHGVGDPDLLGAE